MITIIGIAIFNTEEMGDKFSMQVTQLKRPHTVETIHIRKNCVLVVYLMHHVIWSSEGLLHELYPS